MKLICIKEEEIEERDDTKPLILGKIYEGYLAEYVNGDAWKIKLLIVYFIKLIALIILYHLPNTEKIE